MPFKLTNGPKPVKLGPALDIEMLIIELSVGLLSAVMAIAAYHEKLVVLFLPCAIVALACFFLVLVGILRFVYDGILTYFAKDKGVKISDDRSREIDNDA